MLLTSGGEGEVRIRFTGENELATSCRTGLGNRAREILLQHSICLGPSALPGINIILHSLAAALIVLKKFKIF